MQPRELYRTQQYATAVYRSELAMRLKSIGYEVEQGKSRQPEIKGYSPEYLEASSPRSQQIKEYLAEQGVTGAGAAQIAAHQTRENKVPSIEHDEMQRRHRELAAKFGDQPARVVRESRQHKVEEANPERKEAVFESAIAYARDRNLEREAVVEERELMRDALKRSMGEAGFRDIQNHFERQVNGGEWIELAKVGPGRSFTTGEMIESERNTIAMMRAGQNQYSALAGFEIRREIEQKHDHLSNSQRAAVEQILSSRD